MELHHSKNEHDSKTLELALTSANQTRTTPIKETICDRGYRGVKRSARNNNINTRKFT